MKKVYYLIFIYLFPLLITNNLTSEELIKEQGEKKVNEGESSQKGSLLEGDKIVVTPSTKEETRFESKRAVSTVTKREIIERGIITTPDTVMEEVGVYVQKTGTFAGAPIIRGLIGQQVLHLFDGIRLNTAVSRIGPNESFRFADPFTIDRVEVVRGPESIFYGSDAMGGVVNIVPTYPLIQADKKFNIGANSFGIYSTANSGITNHEDFNLQLGPFGISTGFTGAWIDSVRGGWNTGLQRYTGYSEYDWNTNIGYRINKNNLFYINYFAFRLYDAYRPDKCPPVVENEIRRYSELFHDLAYFKYRYFSVKRLQLLEITTGFKRWHQLIDRFRLDKKRIDTINDTLYGAYFITRGVLDFGKWSNISLGIEYYLDHVNSTQKRTKQETNEVIKQNDVIGDGDPKNDFRGTYVDGSKYHSFGIYMEDNINLISTLNLNVGGRFSYFYVNVPEEPLGIDNPEISSSPIESSFYSIIFSGGVNYTFGPLKLILNVGQAFRAPNLDDITHVGSEGSRFDIQSPELKDPEKSFTGEFGVKLNHKIVYLELFSYYTHFSDLIFPVPTGKTIDNQPATIRDNVNSADMFGVEFYTRVYLTQNWSIFGGLSYIWSEQDCGILGAEEEMVVCEGRVEKEAGYAPENPGRAPMRKIPPLNGIIGLRYQHINNRFFGEALLRWAKKQDNLNPDDMRDKRIPKGGTPGFAIITLRGGYRINRWVSISGVLENITNEDWRIHGSSINGPGINFIGNLHLSY